MQTSDCGSNFFVTKTNISEPRAVVVTGLLCEMNSDVVGIPIVLNTSSLVETVTGGCPI